MNFHDKLNELIRAFKDTDEYKEYIFLKGKIKENPEEYNIIKSFKDKQMQHQSKIINGEQVDKEELMEMQNQYSLIIQKEKLKKLLENEMKINVLLADMQKGIAESIKEIVEF